MPSANRCWATQPIELEDSSDETLLDESAGVHIINDRTDATPDILEDEADPDDDDILIFDGAALDRVEHLPTAAPQPHALPAGSRILVHHGLFGNVNLTSGVNVALVDGDFFRIKYVVKDIYTQCESMHGWRLRRACRVQDRLPKLAGELCLLVTAPIGDTRSDWERGLEELSLEKIDFGAFRWMREIAFTNQEEPAFRDGIGHDRDERRRIITEGRLVCRRKHVVLYAPGNTKLGIKPVEQCIEWLRREEADEGLGIWDEAKILAAGKARDVESVRRNFHPQAKEGIISRLSDPTSRPMKRIKRREGDEGDVQVLDELAFQEAMRRHKQIRTNSDQHSPKRQSHKRILQYQAADMCCGGGGASGGIAETNFKVVWGLDKDLAAARAWSLNWPSATTYHMDIGDFVKYEIDRCAYAHAIHFSFSCKAWSKANPYKGDFEHNPDDIATTLAAPDLLRLLRPRLATFENADAFQTIRKHRDYFNTFLKSIVDMGYNVRWRIVDLARYGNPQHRQRLIVIASW